MHLYEDLFAYSPSRLDPPKSMGAMGKIKRGISVSAYVLSYKYFGTVLSEYSFFFFFRLIRNKVVYKAFWGKWGSIIEDPQTSFLQSLTAINRVVTEKIIKM